MCAQYNSPSRNPYPKKMIGRYSSCPKVARLLALASSAAYRENTSAWTLPTFLAPHKVKVIVDRMLSRDPMDRLCSLQREAVIAFFTSFGSLEPW